MRKLTLLMILALLSHMGYAQVVNDEPAGAISLTVGSTFEDNPFTGTNVDATDSEVTDTSIVAPGCANYQGGDVWYSVTVPANGNIVIETREVINSNFGDTGIAIYNSTDLTTVIACDDTNGLGNFSLIRLTSLTPGDQLLVRVWEFSNNGFGDFTIAAYTADSPSNDETTGAIALTVGNAFEDHPVIGTNLFATASEVTDATIATPGCANYQGGDVWYSVTVPANGNIVIETQAVADSDVFDTGIAVYNSTDLTTVIACNDFGGIGSFSLIILTGLTAGDELLVRSWEDGNDTLGTFTIAAYTGDSPSNDEPTGVIALTVGNAFEDHPVIGTNLFASASEVADATIATPGCALLQIGRV